MIFNTSFRTTLFLGSCAFFGVQAQQQSQQLYLVPYPQQVKVLQGKSPFVLSGDVKIACTVKGYLEASYLQNYLTTVLNNSPEIVGLKDKAPKIIALVKAKGMAEEGYEMQVKDKRIQIKAATRKGWFYGIQTLIQIIDYHCLNNKHLNVPQLDISDAPRFSWRAFMLDESRHFKGKKHVKKLLDEMAHLKMNTFHWHLTDDPGWRIQIKKYPKLTSVGAYRKTTHISNGKRWDSKIQTGEPHGGFYTQDEIKEVIAYAQKLHINIVPEIEMPGHASAAIAAYPWLGVLNKKIEVPGIFKSFEDVYNVADPRVYQFIVNVLDEVMALFPSPVIHIGGDEIQYKQWKESKQVQAYMKAHNIKSPADLHVFFTNRVAAYITSKGRRMMGWNDIMGKNLHHYQDDADNSTGDVELSKSTIVHFWKGDLKLMTAAAREGFQIVNSVHTHTYLDYDYGYTPITKSYNFDPIPKDLEPEYHRQIIGMGCQMWSEWVPSIGQLHYQAFPRIAAYAAVGWMHQKNKDYQRFESSLKQLFKRWDTRFIYYAPLEVARPKKKK